MAICYYYTINTLIADVIQNGGNVAISIDAAQHHALSACA